MCSSLFSSAPRTWPAASRREIVREWLVGNGFVTGKLRVGGRHVDLGRIEFRVLCVVAEKDEIVPAPAASLPELLRNTNAELLRLPAGHISLVCGRMAAKGLRSGDPRMDSAPQREDDVNRSGLILGVDRIADQVSLARRAEAAGFGSVWTTEFHNRNGLVRLAAVAGATSSVKVGTGIAYAYMRAPR